jgi:hypothetical protein
MNYSPLSKNWETSPIGKNWWVRKFRRHANLRLVALESQISGIIRSLGLEEPEPDEIEVSILERIDALEERIKELEDNRQTGT